MPAFDKTWGFSFSRFIALLSGILELTILIGVILNLFWCFYVHVYRDAEMVFALCLQILAALFFLVQITRLFVNWRLAVFGIGRAIIYSLICGLQYL